jgi:hypothetical protein
MNTHDDDLTKLREFDPFRLFQNKLLDDVVRYAICIFALGILAWEYPIGFLLIALCAVIT